MKKSVKKILFLGFMMMSLFVQAQGDTGFDPDVDDVGGQPAPIDTWVIPVLVVMVVGMAFYYKRMVFSKIEK